MMIKHFYTFLVVALMFFGCSEGELTDISGPQGKNEQGEQIREVKNLQVSENTYANVIFRSSLSELYLSSENGAIPMQLDRLKARQWERFTVERLSDGTIAIVGNNGLYVSSENGERPLISYSNNLGEWERFRLEFLGNDEYAIKGNNGRYVSYDYQGKKQLWSTASEIGETERFYIKGLPTVPFGTNSVQLIKEDMTLKNQGYPHGVPSGSPSMSWVFGPRLSLGNDVPPGWTAMITWGQIYEDSEGSPVDPQKARFQIRNMQAWYLSKSTGKWVQWDYTSNITGANYVEDFAGDVNIAADIREESNNGGGISATLQSGYNFHFFPSTGRVTMDPTDVAGVWISMESRLIQDNPNQPVDLSKAKLLCSVGGDYWESLDAVWDQWKTNSDIGIGRHRYLSTKWQSFNMHTLTNEQLATNPPPF